MNLILKMLGGSLGPWLLGGVGALLAIVLGIAGVQTLRLNHAKADQWDRSACAKGQPSCKGVKWKTQVLQLRPALAAAQRDIATCKANTETQRAAIDRQNAATDAAHAETERRAKMLSDALHAARKTAQVANARAEAILTLQPSGSDACAQLFDLDKQISGGAR